MTVQEEQNLFIRPVIGFGLVFLLLSSLFFLPVPKYLQHTLGSAVLNTGHILFFGLFGLVFFRYTRGKVLYRVMLFLSLVFALSLLVESIQSQVGRAFQWGDIMRNELGALLGISLYLCFASNDKRQLYLRLSALLLVIVAVIVERLPLLNAIIAHSA